MWAEHLKPCLREATQEKEPISTRLEVVVNMKHLAFREGQLPAELTRTTMILLPKGQGGYRVIDLVEVIWKTINSTINKYMRVNIYLHHSLYGFW